MRRKLEQERLEQEQKERELIERERKEQERLRREREAEEKRQRRESARRRREEAQKVEYQAILEKRDAREEVHIAKKRLADAARVHEDLELGLQKCEEAVREAEWALEHAVQRRSEAASLIIDSSRKKDAAATQVRGVTDRLKIAQEEEAQSRAQREHAEQEEKKVIEETEDNDEETRRQRELVESIRKMRDLREMEEVDRRDRIEKERQAGLKRQEDERVAQVERDRKEREERERKEREEREEREEKERLEREKREKEQREAHRQRQYEDASETERQRCWQRDSACWNLNSRWIVWTKEHGVGRFQVVSAEFDEIKFCDNQPLTFESVPWPVLASPYHLTVDDIEWSAVEAFFDAAQVIVDESQYKTMVEKAHRRFHPDKWRSRGLLNTVLDFDLRKRLEEAGNIVAQAITPIWLASKSRR